MLRWLIVLLLLWRSVKAFQRQVGSLSFGDKSALHLHVVEFVKIFVVVVQELVILAEVLCSQFHKRVVHKGIWLPLIEAALLIHEIMAVDFHVKLSQEGSQVARLPYLLSPVVALFQHSLWDPTFRSWLGLALLPEDAVEIGGPEWGVVLIDSVDYLQHLAADEPVISIDVQHDVVFLAELVDSFMSVP